MGEHDEFTGGMVLQGEPSVDQSLKLLQDLSRSGKKPVAMGKDEFPLYAEDPFAAIHQQLDAYLGQIPNTAWLWKRVNAGQLPAGNALLRLHPAGKAKVVRAILLRIIFLSGSLLCPTTAADREMNSALATISAWLRSAARALRGDGRRVLNTFAFGPLVTALLKSNLPLGADDLSYIVNTVVDLGSSARWCFVSPEMALLAVERFAESSELTPKLRDELENWQGILGEETKITVADRKLLARIKPLLGEVSMPQIDTGEAWSNAAIADLKGMPADQRSRWSRLLLYCQTADSSKPSQKWLKGANTLVEAVGRDDFKRRLQHWFELVALPRPVHQEPRYPQYDPDPDQLITDANSLILKGLTWCCAGWKDTDVIRAVSRLAQVCFNKVPRLGARCFRVGNACLYSLSGTISDDAAAELSRLNQMVKQPSARKLIGKSLDKAAELSGQTREDMEESTVPTYGLDAAGCLKQSFGNYTAIFCISGPSAMELSWLKADGKPQKSVPAEVKESHADEFKKFKRTLKDIEKMVPAQRARIERLLMSEREWTLDKWLERYLNHPLLSFLARRLIWHFKCGDKTALGAWLDGKLVDVEDRALDWLGPETKVRLWHPIGFDVETVAAWRRWLETHQIAQPFKQAHREVYILTDAEQQTDTYSNRFAAHIIGQHQFAALAKHRGWKYSFMGGFDVQSTPTIELPAWAWPLSIGWNRPTNWLKPAFRVISPPIKFASSVAGRQFRCAMFRWSSSPKSCATWISLWVFAASAMIRHGWIAVSSPVVVIIGKAILSATSPHRRIRAVMFWNACCQSSRLPASAN